MASTGTRRNSRELEETRLRLLDIGCGTAEEAGVLPASGAVAEFVGVDLDEMAIARARRPQATFLCADAAGLPAEYQGRFHIALICRPDLFAPPGRWRQVFEVLSELLQPPGRALVTLIGEGEAAVAHAWLEANDLSVIHAETRSEPEGSHLLVAETAVSALQVLAR